MKPAKRKPLRDPIHNYVYMTDIEREVIDRQEFQRLRFIFQNSSAYLTYPGNYNMRFLHSLGAAHVCGQLYIAALRNAEVKTVQKFLQDMGSVIRILEKGFGPRGQLAKEWGNRIGNQSGFSHPSWAPNEEEKYLIELSWQSLRLAMLVHDIGHLPLSHVFERAIEEYLEDASQQADDAFVKDYQRRLKRATAVVFDRDGGETVHKHIGSRLALHELFGLEIAEGIYPKGRDPLVLAIYRFAKHLLVVASFKGERRSDDSADVQQAHERDFDVLGWATNILKGEMDADRLDYTLRDPKMSGLELGAFDIVRIIEAAELHCENDGQYKLVFHSRAISAIEAFFHQRFLLYRYLYYHPVVVATDGAAARILTLLFGVAPRTRVLGEVLSFFGFWCEEKRTSGVADPSGVHFMPLLWENYDDAWLRTVFCSVLRKIEESHPHLDKDNEETAVCRELKVLLQTFLFRVRGNVELMWSRDAECEQIRREIVRRGYPVTSMRMRDREAEARFVGELRRRLREQQVFVVYRRTKGRFLQKSDAPIWIKTSGGMENILDVSPYLSSLSTTVAGTPNFQIAVVGEDIRAREDVRDRCREAVVQGLIDAKCLREAEPKSAE